MPNFTRAQLDAIQARGENLLISAAAGSGKTAVLVERIVSLLAQGASLEGMLVVTYTRAAAAEMRSRIGERIAKEGASRHLRAQAALLPRAQIKTLHSFCAWLLKRHFLEADLPPAFAVDAGPGLAAMRARAMNEALDEALSDEQIAAALSRLGKDYQYERLIGDTSTFLLNQVDPAAWAERALSQYAAMLDDFASSSYTQPLSLHRETLYSAAAGRLMRALEIARMPKGPSHYAPVLEGDLTTIAALGRGERAEFERLSSKKAPDEALKEAAKALRDEAKDLALKARSIGGPDARNVDRMRSMRKPLEALMRVSLDFLARYERMRVDAGRLDYSDLEHRALCALSDGRAAEALRSRFDFILVDEYQDANAVQEAVLSAIARADNRFMVGDVKQSIYRFRMADPTIFLDKQQRYGRGDGGRRIDLNLNFRSAPAVLHAVNHVFARAMAAGSEIIYDESAALYPGRRGEIGPPVDVVLLERPQAEEHEGNPRDQESGEAEEALVTWSDAELEANEVARLAQALIGQTLSEDGEPVRARDIAILMRTVSGPAELFRAALEARGIAANVDAGGALLSAPEVRCFLDLLRSIDNRRRDVPLLGAMRMFGAFTPEELARVRLCDPKAPFAAAAFLCAQGDTPLSEKNKAFLNRLLAWREGSRALPLADFLAMVLEETRHERTSALKPRGALRVKNLRALTALAVRMPGASLGEFLDAVSLMERTGGDGDAARIPAEDQDAVRIMSVHKSKGLEFPVVIGCGLGRRINQIDARRPLLLSGRYGIATQWVDEKVSLRARTAAQDALAVAIERENANEEARVLYVLMTRPKQKLVLTAAVPSAQKAAQRWSAMGDGLYEARTLMDLIGPALIRHPDGEPLRALMDCPPAAAAHAARYRVRITGGGEEFPHIEQFDSLSQTLLAQDALAGRNVPAPLAARLGYRPAASGSDLPQKTSVTAAARKGAGAGQLPPALPRFLEDRRESPAAQRGLAMHAALRALDFAALRGLDMTALRAQVDDQIARMIKDLLLTSAQAEGIRPGAITQFLHSPLGQEALASPELLREQPFNLRVDDGEAVRLMQGIIDLCFVDTAGRWVLIDYKTDRHALDPAKVRDRHGSQLHSYARALEALTGRDVSKKLVYLFETGEAVEVS